LLGAGALAAQCVALALERQWILSWHLDRETPGALVGRKGTES